MRPDSAETDKAAVDASVSGIASASASVTPAVAIATVRQASRTTIPRNSGSTFGTMKLSRNRSVNFRLCGSTSTQGSNSVATSIGASSTMATLAQNTRRAQAGSRDGGAGVATAIN